MIILWRRTTGPISIAYGGMSLRWGFVPIGSAPAPIGGYLILHGVGGYLILHSEGA